MAKKLGIAALSLVIMGGVGLWAAGNQTPQLSALAPVAADAQETAAPTAAIEIKDFTLGAPDAKVKLTEYASFTCPHCANFHKDVFVKLKADYIDTGKVLFEYREVYFDRYGLWAAMMARCGGEMRYFGITDKLFETQAEWAATDDPAAVVENLKKIGRTAGMDDAAMDICMKDPALADALVAHFETNFKADGIEGTPSILINGVKHPNMAYEDLKVVLDAELAK
jgi:protein-disulfide isomerase